MVATYFLGAVPAFVWRKTTRKLNQDSQSLGRDSIPEPPEYEARLYYPLITSAPDDVDRDSLRNAGLFRRIREHFSRSREHFRHFCLCIS